MSDCRHRLASCATASRPTTPRSAYVVRLTQNVEHKFDQVARDPRFTFLGNVRVTADDAPRSPPTEHVSLRELAPYYTHILFSYGASDARALHVPGSSGELDRVYSALDFVQWYNGHPDAHAAGARLNAVDGRRIHDVAVVGAGNVALDVARILLRQCRAAPPAQRLADTDVPQTVLERLRTWDVRHVGLFVRRGAAELAFTNKELREMLALPHVALQPLDPAVLDTALAHVAQSTDAGTKRAKTRLLQQLKKGSRCAYSPSHVPTWGVHLHRAPRAFTGDGGVAQAHWDVTEVVDGRAQTTGATETTQTDLVVASVGYRSRPLDGSPGALPFDTQRHRVPNEQHRVVAAQSVVPGMYVSGWLATGPVGVIASTMMDAFAAADTILADWAVGRRTLCASAGQAEPLGGEPEALAGRRVVRYDDWRQIDAAERARGAQLGKCREKFLSVEAMLDVVS